MSFDFAAAQMAAASPTAGFPGPVPRPGGILSFPGWQLAELDNKDFALPFPKRIKARAARASSWRLGLPTACKTIAWAVIASVVAILMLIYICSSVQRVTVGLLKRNLSNAEGSDLPQAMCEQSDGESDEPSSEDGAAAPGSAGLKPRAKMAKAESGKMTSVVGLSQLPGPFQILEESVCFQKRKYLVLARYFRF